jgi:hypothetical protein
MEEATTRYPILRTLVVIAVAMVLSAGFAQFLEPLRINGSAGVLLAVGFVPEFYWFATGRQLGPNRLVYRGMAIGAFLMAFFVR